MRRCWDDRHPDLIALQARAIIEKAKYQGGEDSLVESLNEVVEKYSNSAAAVRVIFEVAKGDMESVALVTLLRRNREQGKTTRDDVRAAVQEAYAEAKEIQRRLYELIVDKYGESPESEVRLYVERARLLLSGKSMFR